MKFRGHTMLLAAVAVAALAVPLTIQSVGAQEAPQGQDQQGAAAGPRNQQRALGQGQGQGFGQQGGPGQQGQGFPGQGGQGGMQMMMGGGGGGATMVVDGNFLFILRGNSLYKVQKETLKVVAEGELPMPQMRGGPGGQPGNFQPQQRGGGNAPPPPPSE